MSLNVASPSARRQTGVITSRSPKATVQRATAGPALRISINAEDEPDAQSNVVTNAQPAASTPHAATAAPASSNRRSTAKRQSYNNFSPTPSSPLTTSGGGSTHTSNLYNLASPKREAEPQLTYNDLKKLNQQLQQQLADGQSYSNVLKDTLAKEMAQREFLQQQIERTASEQTFEIEEEYRRRLAIVEARHTQQLQSEVSRLQQQHSSQIEQEVSYQVAEARSTDLKRLKSQEDLEREIQEQIEMKYQVQLEMLKAKLSAAEDENRSMVLTCQKYREMTNSANHQVDLHEKQRAKLIAAVIKGREARKDAMRLSALLKLSIVKQFLVQWRCRSAVKRIISGMAQLDEMMSSCDQALLAIHDHSKAPQLLSTAEEITADLPIDDNAVFDANTFVHPQEQAVEQSLRTVIPVYVEVSDNMRRPSTIIHQFNHSDLLDNTDSNNDLAYQQDEMDAWISTARPLLRQNNPRLLLMLQHTVDGFPITTVLVAKLLAVAKHWKKLADYQADRVNTLTGTLRELKVENLKIQNDAKQVQSKLIEALIELKDQSDKLNGYAADDVADGDDKPTATTSTTPKTLSRPSTPSLLGRSPSERSAAYARYLTDNGRRSSMMNHSDVQSLVDLFTQYTELTDDLLLRTQSLLQQRQQLQAESASRSSQVRKLQLANSRLINVQNGSYLTRQRPTLLQQQLSMAQTQPLPASVQMDGDVRDEEKESDGKPSYTYVTQQHGSHTPHRRPSTAGKRDSGPPPPMMQELQSGEYSLHEALTLLTSDMKRRQDDFTNIHSRSRSAGLLKQTSQLYSATQTATVPQGTRSQSTQFQHTHRLSANKENLPAASQTYVLSQPSPTASSKQLQKPAAPSVPQRLPSPVPASSSRSIKPSVYQPYRFPPSTAREPSLEE